MKVCCSGLRRGEYGIVGGLREIIGIRGCLKVGCGAVDDTYEGFVLLLV